jgi:tRNA dimethylallyltransferase
MGPTASGKTETAIKVADNFSVDLVSVDSALVYRGMNIGTAKPGDATLRKYPHRLVDTRDPEESYSAGEFVRDALTAIDEIHAARRVPLLVGGTMMYFRALIDGIADLPEGDPATRAAIDNEAVTRGWPGLHRELEVVDPAAAARINPNDSQRIQRALEVYRLSGRRLSAWQTNTAPTRTDLVFYKIALIPEPRSVLHSRIEKRLDLMLEQGFLDEVRDLMKRPGLTAEHPSMRAVGYRQYWRYIEGSWSREEARSRALAATRQLAKRQLTWLRSESDKFVLNPLETGADAAISDYLRQMLVSHKN